MKVTFVLKRGDDELVLDGELEEFAAQMPLLYESEWAQRFLSRPVPAASAPKAAAAVTAADVKASATGKPTAPSAASRSETIANDDRPATAGILLLVEKRTGQPAPAGITMAAAKALLAEGGD